MQKIDRWFIIDTCISGIYDKLMLKDIMLSVDSSLMSGKLMISF